MNFDNKNVVITGGTTGIGLATAKAFISAGASVIFTSSTVATAANVGSSIYAATKGAINKVAQVAANELADRKIRVNIVSPGPVETPGLNGVVSPEVKDYLGTATSLQRLGRAGEIASTVMFLASDAASFITGTELVADGGYLNYATK